MEEACNSGGFSCFLVSEIQAKAFDYLDAPIIRVTGLDIPIPYSNILEDYVIPNEVKIKNGILEVLR